MTLAAWFNSTIQQQLWAYVLSHFFVEIIKVGANLAFNARVDLTALGHLIAGELAFDVGASALKRVVIAFSEFLVFE